MKPTDTSNSDHFHQVVNCQWSCPAHTPVPEYLRMIATGRYTDAYMLNWYANVFPGVLGRVCDRPCESACRRAGLATIYLLAPTSTEERMRLVAPDVLHDEITIHDPVVLGDAVADEPAARVAQALGGVSKSELAAREADLLAAPRTFHEVTDQVSQ